MKSANLNGQIIDKKMKRLGCIFERNINHIGNQLVCKKEWQKYVLDT